MLILLVGSTSMVTRSDTTIASKYVDIKRVSSKLVKTIPSWYGLYNRYLICFDKNDKKKICRLMMYYVVWENEKNPYLMKHCQSVPFLVSLKDGTHKEDIWKLHRLSSVREKLINGPANKNAQLFFKIIFINKKLLLRNQNYFHFQPHDTILWKHLKYFLWTPTANICYSKRPSTRLWLECLFRFHRTSMAETLFPSIIWYLCEV